MPMLQMGSLADICSTKSHVCFTPRIDRGQFVQRFDEF